MVITCFPEVSVISARLHNVASQTFVIFILIASKRTNVPRFLLNCWLTQIYNVTWEMA
jgi:hypothetical protein